MLFQYIKKLIAVAAIVVLQFSISGTALAQPGGPELDRTIPTPRLNGGKVDFGGDGVSIFKIGRKIDGTVCVCIFS